MFFHSPSFTIEYSMLTSRQSKAACNINTVQFDNFLKSNTTTAPFIRPFPQLAQLTEEAYSRHRSIARQLREGMSLEIGTQGQRVNCELSKVREVFSDQGSKAVQVQSYYLLNQTGDPPPPTPIQRFLLLFLHS